MVFAGIWQFIYLKDKKAPTKQNQTNNNSPCPPPFKI